jgi:hypothetical protein
VLTIVSVTPMGKTTLVTVVFAVDTPEPEGVKPAKDEAVETFMGKLQPSKLESAVEAFAAAMRETVQ